MCRNVIFEGETYETQRELMEICPNGIFVCEYHPDTCLCPVDLRLTGEENGYDVDEDSDPFDVIFTRKAGLK